MWDYATVLLLPVAIWAILGALGLGAASLVNFVIEPLVLVFLVPAAHSIRVFIVDPRWKNPVRSSLVTASTLCFVVPLILRLVTPGIPE